MEALRRHNLEESILISIKKLLGISEEDEHFDLDIIMHINSVFSILSQLGVGPENGFRIIDENVKWSDYLKGNTKLEFVKTYIHMKVKLMFDPPLSSSAIESINKQINELEWRISVATDTNSKEENQNGE